MRTRWMACGIVTVAVASCSPGPELERGPPPLLAADSLRVESDEAPTLLSMDAPEYPDAARTAGIEGTVLVRALVGRRGNVEEAYVIEGDPVLGKASVTAAKTALFIPATKDGSPVAVWLVIPITFELGR